MGIFFRWLRYAVEAGNSLELVGVGGSDLSGWRPVTVTKNGILTTIGQKWAKT
jgi:hypothetical protein